MDPVIERVCNTTEREILAPHVERLLDTIRILDNAAGALEPRMATEDLVFDPQRYAWIRFPKPEQET